MRTAVVALAVVAALTGGVSAQKAVADQKAALLTFAKSTQSNFWKWTTTNKWVEATDPCETGKLWDFVTCGTTGDIIALAFSGNNLQGKIPTAITKLTGLTKLTVDKNTGIKDFGIVSQLTSLKELAITKAPLTSIPAGFSKLTKLATLDLHENQNLKGSIPAGLSKLTDLTKLDISKNQISGALPVGFSKLEALVTFDASVNRMTGNVPKQFSKLTKLVTLDLEENKFSKPIPVDLTVLAGPLSINTCGNAPDFHIYDSAGDVADPDKGTAC